MKQTTFWIKTFNGESDSSGITDSRVRVVVTLHYIKSYLECPKSLRTARTLYEIKGVMWEYSYVGKHLEKRQVFKRLQKTGRVCADLMSGGKLFPTQCPPHCKDQQS